MTRDELIKLFETGDKPTGADFRALIEFFLAADLSDWPEVLPASSGKNLTEIAAQTTVNAWQDVDQAVGYIAGDEVVLSTDLETTFIVGRRVRLTLDSGFVYSEVVSATYDGDANATSVVLADAVADSTLEDIDVSIFLPVAAGGAVGLGTLGGTAFAETLLDDADAIEARATLGLPINLFDGIVAPTVNDDALDGFVAGSVWINSVTKKAYACINPAAGAAVWADMTPFQPGDRCFFQQTTVPAGWSKDTSISSNSALRLVTGSVSSFTGGSTFTATFAASRNVSDVTLNANQSGNISHDHTTYEDSGVDGAAGGAINGVTASRTGTTGTSAASASNSHNHNIAMNVNYYDAVIGQKL